MKYSIFIFFQLFIEKKTYMEKIYIILVAIATFIYAAYKKKL